MDVYFARLDAIDRAARQRHERVCERLKDAEAKGARVKAYIDYSSFRLEHVLRLTGEMREVIEGVKVGVKLREEKEEGRGEMWPVLREWLIGLVLCCAFLFVGEMLGAG